MIEDDDTNDLIFAIQRSVRYHDRRVAHFDVLHKITSVLTILMSGIVILDLAGTESRRWIKVIAAVAAVLGAFDLVVGYSHRATQHRELKRQFCALERRLVKARTSDEIQEIQADRLLIEADEPPIFRALDAQCHNDILIAKGYSPIRDRCQFHIPRWYQRWTANWFRWSNLTSNLP